MQGARGGGRPRPRCANADRSPARLPTRACSLLLILVGAASLVAGVFSIAVRERGGQLGGQRAARGSAPVARTETPLPRARCSCPARHPPVTVRTTAQVAPLLPPSPRPWLAAVQGDRHYCLLVPLSVPVTLAAVGLNWFCLKLFKHNS